MATVSNTVSSWTLSSEVRTAVTTEAFLLLSTDTVENGTFIHYNFSVVDVSVPRAHPHHLINPHISSDQLSSS